LKLIFDTDFEYRLKPFKTKIDTQTENKIKKINISNQNRN